MSITSNVVADELSVLVRSSPYDAGQRALWHLDSVGSIIDCSCADLSPDLQLLSAIPQAQRPFASSGAFSHSTSSEEFGLRVFPPSPRSAGSVSPALPDSHCRYAKITSKTKIKFFYPKCVTVFSLDLSPSMNVVDTSFKSLTLGCHLVDTLVRALEISLKALLRDSGPEIIVTVIAHGVPGRGVVPLIVGSSLASDTDPISPIIKTVTHELRAVIQTLCKWLQKNFEDERKAGSLSCSRTRNPCTSTVCQANDVSTIVRDCLTAISMTCGQFGLSKSSGVAKSILIVTDGVLSHPRKLPFDNALMHLNFVDVTLHIIQVGGGFAPWSALGYASDPDLLGLLAASTPMGLFLQDHHIESGSSALWLACVCRLSSMTAKGVHTPYKAASYQSSSLDRAWAFSSYLGQLGLARKEHAVQLQGIGEIGESSVGSWSPMNEAFVCESDSDREQYESPRPMSLKAYLKPEKSKARPYLFKQYKLLNVSTGQLVQLRVREGFVFCPSEGGLARNASLNAVSTGGEKEQTISLSTHWGPVIDIIYEISPLDSLVKIYLRMPSGDFFLRFKQEVAGGGQMCMQLNSFVESILAVDDGLAKISSTINSEISLLHRWFAVKNVFVLLKVQPPARLRQGSLDALLRAAREQLIQEIKSFPDMVSVGDSGLRFVCNNLEEERFKDTHAANVLTMKPLVVVDLPEQASENYTIGIARINLAFIATSPRVDKAFVDRLSNWIKSGTVVEAASPIVRAVQAGLVVPTKPLRKQPSVRRKSAAVGMGGESFYTFDPDVEAVNRFTRYHAWETSCPPAALASDVLTHIHGRRIAENWDCVYESSNAAIYVKFTPFEKTERSFAHAENSARNVWFPQVREMQDGVCDEIKARTATADWDKLIKQSNVDKVPGRNAVKGACMCLGVQHVQARGEKPILKCRLWVDRGHPRWAPSVLDSEFHEFGISLCAEQDLISST